MPLTLAQLTVPETLPGAWTYEGCYVDVPGRTLGGAGYADGEEMTIESCLAFCTSKGFAYAGTEYSVECFCGSSIAAAATELTDADCNMPCSGDATQPCGAGSKLSLFHTTEITGPQTNPGADGWEHLGCYTEGTTGRALTFGAGGIPNAEMTVAKCTAACRAANYVLAGVEYGGECCKSCLLARLTQGLELTLKQTAGTRSPTAPLPLPAAAT